jgi:Outer membrane protein beta-barrel domain
MRSRLGWLFVIASGPLVARAAPRDTPWSLFAGGGASFPLSDSAERFEPGWNFAAGITWHAGDRLGLRLDYLYAEHDVKGHLDDLRLDASHSVQHAAASVVLGTLAAEGPRVYALAGPALYFRAVDITRLDNVVASFCDPWLFVCFTGPVQVEQVIGSRDATDWGLQGGVGLSFRTGDHTRFFLEARYHYIFGDAFEGRAADGQYVPITLGVEF